MIPSNQQPHSSSTSNEQRPATASLAGLMAPVQCALNTVDGTAELRVRGLSMDRTLLLLAESGDEGANLVLGFKTEATLLPSSRRTRAISTFMKRVNFLIESPGSFCSMEQLKMEMRRPCNAPGNVEAACLMQK